MTDGGVTIRWCSVISFALWTAAGSLIALDLTGVAGLRAIGIFGSAAAATWTVCAGQRRCQRRMQVAISRAIARQEVEQQVRTGPRKLV